MHEAVFALQGIRVIEIALNAREVSIKGFIGFQTTIGGGSAGEQAGPRQPTEEVAGMGG
jgi:hypothetical protein